MDFLLTIAIPTYNRLPYLKEALASILPQLTDEMELLISDNGSEDGTWAYVQSIPQARAVRFEQNMGFDQNIVRCVREAKGRYIAFFGDDDLADPHAFAKMIEVLKESKPKILYVNHFPFFNGNLSQRLKPYLPGSDRCFENGWAFFCFCGLGHISSLTVEKEAAQRYLADVKDGRMCAHLDIAGRIALKERGPFYYLGTLSVAGRTPDQVRYVPIKACVIDQARFWRDLKEEGVIDAAQYASRLRALIRLDLIKMAFKARVAGDLSLYRDELEALFSTDRLYRLCVRPFYTLPPKLLAPCLSWLKKLLSIKRSLIKR